MRMAKLLAERRRSSSQLAVMAAALATGQSSRGDTSGPVISPQHNNNNNNKTLCLTTGRRLSDAADIVKTGSLHIKRPPNGVKIRIKAWQKRFFVLRDDSFENGTSRLDIFMHKDDWDQENSSGIPFKDKYVVDLRNVSFVDEYNESKSFPFAFIVTRKGQSPLVLGAESDIEMKEWLIAIKVLSQRLKSSALDAEAAQHEKQPASRRPSCPSRINLDVTSGRHVGHQVRSCGNSARSSPDLRGSPKIRILRLPKTVNPEGKQFTVKVQTTESSLRNDLQGEYFMAVRDDDVILRRQGAPAAVARWPIIHIRKFKCEDLSDATSLVTLEATTKCQRLDGVYLFKTTQGHDLTRHVKEANERVTNEGAINREQEREVERLRQLRMFRAPSAPQLDLATFSGRSHTAATGSPTHPLPGPLSSYLDLLPEEATAAPPLATSSPTKTSSGCHDIRGFQDSFRSDSRRSSDGSRSSSSGSRRGSGASGGRGTGGSDVGSPRVPPRRPSLPVSAFPVGVSTNLGSPTSGSATPVGGFADEVDASTRLDSGLGESLEQAFSLALNSPEEMSELISLPPAPPAPPPRPQHTLGPHSSPTRPTALPVDCPPDLPPRLPKHTP